MSNPETEAPESEIIACPACGQSIEVGGLGIGTQIECPSCAHTFPVSKMFHHYELQEQIGEGGMGTVYQANDVNLNRRVAVKVLKRELSEDKKFIANFLREVEITASLTHPNIVQVFNFGDYEGHYYLVMEYIGHQTFDDRITGPQRMTEHEVLDIGIGVANGLNFALQRGGLIHRDIKPGNILFAPDGSTKVVDFGLAITPDTADSSGEIWGTPYYVSPERLEGKTEDFRSDMYSLGISLYHALAGRPPFDASTAELVAAKHLNSTPLPLKTFAPQTSDHCTYAIMKAMARQMDDRFQSYGEFIEQMEDAKRRLMEHETGLIPRKETYEVSVPEEDSKTAMMVIIAVVVVIVLVVGGIIAWQYMQAV